MQDLIGKRIKIIDHKHPHSGETGTITSIDNLPMCKGYKVQLEDCPHGTSACYVFAHTEIKYLK